MLPPTDVERALAASLVDEALKDFERTVPKRTLTKVREHMIDELLCTPYGRRRLEPFLERKAPDHSEEQSKVEGDEKKKAGGEP
ncbi:MAG: hypothetical protein HOW73_50280 [Polyangiaceae bacterium]|nr:hypothetical protein [Polyangiaceae bacterium]